MRITYVLFVIGLAANSSPQSLEDETVTRLAEYLRIDTINPPGNESNAVDFFAKLLDAESDIRREDGENKISALIGAVAENVFRLDQHGLILAHHSSERARPFTDAESVLGRKIADILPESVTDTCVKALASVVVGGETVALQFSIDLGTATCSYQAHFAPSGQHEVLLTVRDLTEQKEKDSSKPRLDAILNATLDPVVTVTQEGEISYLNPVGFQLLGLEAPLEAGLKIADFLPEWARDQVQKTAIRTAIEEGKWQGESALLAPGDTEIPVSMTAVSHPTDSSEVELVSLIARDQSERKRFDDHLLFLADHDPLTSLYTRRRFLASACGRTKSRRRNHRAPGGSRYAEGRWRRSLRDRCPRWRSSQ